MEINFKKYLPKDFATVEQTPTIFSTQPTLT